MGEHGAHGKAFDIMKSIKGSVGRVLRQVGGFVLCAAVLGVGCKILCEVGLWALLSGREAHLPSIVWVVLAFGAFDYGKTCVRLAGQLLGWATFEAEKQAELEASIAAAKAADDAARQEYFDAMSLNAQRIVDEHLERRASASLERLVKLPEDPEVATLRSQVQAYNDPNSDGSIRDDGSAEKPVIG